MVLRVDVVDAALRAVYGDAGPPRPPTGRVVVLAPSGRPFDDAIAEEFAGLESLTLLSGRYEGIDERVREQLADDAVSIGPYVLSGGEPAAMVVADAVLRKLPGALGDERSAVEESFSRRWREASSTPTTRAPPRIGAGRCRTSCCPATTSRSAAGGWSRRAGAARGPRAGRETAAARSAAAASANISAPIESPATPPPKAAFSRQ